MPQPRVHQLVERLTSLFQESLRRTASDHGLKLVQLEALIYLSQANRYSDTPAALTEYLGTTKGTVSQTLKALERHGLLRKEPDPDDGRKQHCRLTPEATAIVRQAYPTGVLEAADDEDAAALERLLRRIQRAGDRRTFGICHTCRFFEPRPRGGLCGLTEEALTKADSTKLCREHALPVVR